MCRGILIEAVFPCIQRKFARRVQFMWKLTMHEIDLGNFWNRKPKSRSFPPELTRRKLLEECQYSILAPVSNLTQFHFFQLTYNSYISQCLWISLCTEHDSVIIWVHAKVLILDRTIGNCKIEMHVHRTQFMWVCLVGSTNANITTNLLYLHFARLAQSLKQKQLEDEEKLSKAFVRLLDKVSEEFLALDFSIYFVTLWHLLHSI